MIAQEVIRFGRLALAVINPFDGRRLLSLSRDEHSYPPTRATTHKAYTEVCNAIKLLPSFRVCDEPSKNENIPTIYALTAAAVIYETVKYHRGNPFTNSGTAPVNYARLSSEGPAL
jgi:hypothetical protein